MASKFLLMAIAKHPFMLGGRDADSLSGGDKSDLLVDNDVEWRLAA